MPEGKSHERQGKESLSKSSGSFEGLHWNERFLHRKFKMVSDSFVLQLSKGRLREEQ